MDRVAVFQTVITGLGATCIMDLWSCFQKRIIKVPPLNYALVGRWVLWLPRGKLWHNMIVSTPPVPKEFLTGWLFHYLAGIIFAFIPFFLRGPGWLRDPFLVTALLSGLLTVLAPFIILQPVFGFGIAASRTPRPGLTRLLSLFAHLAYGVGLYIAALSVNFCS